MPAGAGCAPAPAPEPSEELAESVDSALRPAEVVDSPVSLLVLLNTPDTAVLAALVLGAANWAAPVRVVLLERSSPKGAVLLMLLNSSGWLGSR